MQRASMYLLTPHNYTALCLANRFRGWHRTFMGLAGIQVLADLSSCLGLAALMAGAIEKQTEEEQMATPTAIIIGYVITASGFILFFGPLSVVTSLRGAADTSRHSCVRAGLGLAGSALLCALTYTMLLYVLLIGGWFNPYCSGFTLSDDPCNGHGKCYGVSQCRCELGFGPEVSYSGEPLCAWRGAACTGGQLRRAVTEHEETSCGGLHFSGSRLITPEWGAALTGWVGSSVATDEWTLCYSSFTDDATTPAVSHSQCDAYNATVSVARNAGDGPNPGNYTFGGFGAGSWSKEACCEDPRNDCESTYCFDHTSSQDFLFGLWMPGREGGGGPQRYLPTGADTDYQLVGPGYWPYWGTHSDLTMGYSGPLGGSTGYCNQGSTYAGSRNEICGGYDNWGATQLEVWRPACTTCGGHGACDPSTRVCRCDAGFKRENAATCVVDFCYENDCSGHGSCEPFAGVCVCDFNYRGADCSEGRGPSPLFPGTRLIADEWGGTLNDWTTSSVPDGEWTRAARRSRTTRRLLRHSTRSATRTTRR